jgi:cytochrome c
MREIAVLAHHDDPVYGIAVAPDGKTALWGGRDGVLQLWDMARRAFRRAIRTHVRPVWAVAYAGGGQFGISAGSDGALRVWHLETGDRIGIPGEGDAGPKPWLTSDHPGARFYRKCAVCHSLKPGIAHRSGPPLAGLFGRRVGSVPGYNYSSALRDAEFQWNERTLFALFDKGPDVFLPGTKMPVQRIPHPEDLHQLIDYLRVLTAVTPDGATETEKGR